MSALAGPLTVLLLSRQVKAALAHGGVSQVAVVSLGEQPDLKPAFWEKFASIEDLATLKQRMVGPGNQT